MSKVAYIPQGYNSVTPYLIIKGAAQAIDYYKKVFGATEVFRMDQPGGKVGHAELKIGTSHIMLADADKMFGGHLEPGTNVFTFAVVTLGVLDDKADLKRLDDKTLR